MGSGTLITSIWKALKELEYLDLITNFPRICGVQSKACDPIVRALKGNSSPQPLGETIAADIVFERPARMKDAIRAIKETKGQAISVSDSEILECMSLLAKYEGVLAEPSAATTLAALIKLLNYGVIDKDEKVVLIITGSGLKGIGSIAKRMIKDALSFSEEYIPLGRVKREIIKIISFKEGLHGYAIWKILNKKGFEITKTAVYKHIKDLENMGILKRKIEGKVNKYFLTKEGIALLNLLKLEA